MEKASGGTFARTIRKTAEDEGRRRGGLGHDATHIQALRAWLLSCPSGTKAIRPSSHSSIEMPHNYLIECAFSPPLMGPVI